MPANLEDVREWMAEGDRLLAQAYDYLNVGTADPLQLDLAGRHFSRAAQAYLAGGVEYQHGPDPAVQAGAVIDDPAALIGRLDGHLRDEADAAAKAAGGPSAAKHEARPKRRGLPASVAAGDPAHCELRAIGLGSWAR